VPVIRSREIFGLSVVRFVRFPIPCAVVPRTSGRTAGAAGTVVMRPSVACGSCSRRAEGENKIALAKCEALAGDAQKACKDQANAELKLVKERAKAPTSDRG
jgi:hypothetical protein